MRHLKDQDGTVHFDGPVGDDYLLCGFNADEVTETTAGVDCSQCIAVVEFCHRIRDGEIKPRFERRRA